MGRRRQKQHSALVLQTQMVISKSKKTILWAVDPKTRQSILESSNQSQQNPVIIEPVQLVTVVRYPSEGKCEEGNEKNSNKAVKQLNVRKRLRKSEERQITKKRKPKDPYINDKSIGLPQSGETACPICGEMFDDHEHLVAHVEKDGHYERNWMCKLCNKRFITRGTLQEHIRFVHAKNSRDHIRCGKKFDPSENYEVNLREEIMPHLEDSLPCDVCGKLFKG